MALVAKYSLNGNANDALGVNNWTATNITWVDWKLNQAASFNGTSSDINCGNWSALNITWTQFSCWFIIRPWSTMVNNWIIFKWSAINTQWVYSIWFYNWSAMKVVVRLNWAVTEWIWQLTSATTLVSWTTYHVVVTYNWSNISIYINWILDASNSYTTALASDTNNLYLWLYYSTLYRYNWMLDEVELYNHVLNPWEIKMKYVYYLWY